MASKIDKLRKLHADKALTEDELDNIAGGSTQQTAGDSKFLNVLLRGHPAQPDRYGVTKMNIDYANNGSRLLEITKAWNACGIDAYLSTGDKGNRYFIGVGGREVSQAEARQYAMDRIGKQLKVSDWYWS